MNRNRVNNLNKSHRSTITLVKNIMVDSFTTHSHLSIYSSNHLMAQVKLLWHLLLHFTLFLRHLHLADLQPFVHLHL